MALPARDLLGGAQWLLYCQPCRLQDAVFWNKSLCKCVFLDQNEEWITGRKEPHSFCVFLFTQPGIFTLIEQALETLNAHQSCAFGSFYQ